MDENQILIGEFLDDKRLSLSPNTISGYNSTLNKFCRFNKKPLNSVTHSDIVAYLNKILFEEKLSRAWASSVLITLRMFYKFMLDNGYMSSNPTKGIKSIKRDKRLPEYLSEQEIDTIINTAALLKFNKDGSFRRIDPKNRKIAIYCYLLKGNDMTMRQIFEDLPIGSEDLRQGLKELTDMDLITPCVDGNEIRYRIDNTDKVGLLDPLIIKFLYATGVRISELVNIKQGDIDFIHGTIKIFGKGSKERIVLFPDKFRPYLYHQCLNLKEDQRVFDLSIYDIERKIKIIGRIAGINKNVTPHKFRHSFATHMLQNGGDVVAIQKLLGHESLNTTQIYLDVSDEWVRDVYNSVECISDIVKPDVVIGIRHHYHPESEARIASTDFVNGVLSYHSKVKD